MLVKVLEIRDRATFIPVLAVETRPSNSVQEFYLQRVGFIDGKSIMITQLRGESPASSDPYFWRDRTMQTAHHYIEQNWNSLRDGDVIDVEFILSETPVIKTSERFDTT